MASWCVASRVLRLGLISFKRVCRLSVAIFSPVVGWGVWMGRAMVMTWVTWPAPPATVRHGPEWKASPALHPRVKLLLLGSRFVAMVGAAEERMVLSPLFEASDPIPKRGCLVVVIN